MYEKNIINKRRFENKNLEKRFLEMVKKDPKDIKALFVTTAAVEPDAIIMLPKCLKDLLNCGILTKNITVYDMHKLISTSEIKMYDVVYVCGGRTSYLVDRINEVGFKTVIDDYITNGGIYIGVSAGSIAASGKYENGLNFIKNILNVHCDNGTKNGNINSSEEIFLTDNQAILITDDCIKVIE